jgi:hyaluronan synthase/N-acetylglucosaminyltransferase
VTEIGHDFLLDLLHVVFLLYTALVVGHFALQTLYAHLAWRRCLAASVGEVGGSSFVPGVDVIVTSYQEDPERLAACLAALSGQDYEGPLGVYVVDDGSPNRGRLMPIYERFEQQADWRVLLLERNVGKRHAQAHAYGRSNGELVVTIDSDTEVASDGIRTIVTAFRDDSVGAVTGSVGVSNATQNLLTRLIGFRYWFAFNQERAAQSFFRTVLCCSGPFSVYRRSVLDVVWKRYTEQSFRGVPCTYGDDRHLTNLVLGAGFDALYEPRAHALTHAPTGIAEYLKQQLRWNKSFYRELLWTSPFLLQRSWFTTFDVVAQTLLPFLLTVAITSATFTAVLVDPIRGAHYAGTILVMSLLRIAYAIFRTRNSRFLLFTLYGFLHAAVLMPVRLRALATLTDNRWGTRAAMPATGAGGIAMRDGLAERSAEARPPRLASLPPPPWALDTTTPKAPSPVPPPPWARGPQASSPRRTGGRLRLPRPPLQ